MEGGGDGGGGSLGLKRVGEHSLKAANFLITNSNICMQNNILYRIWKLST